MYYKLWGLWLNTNDDIHHFVISRVYQKKILRDYNFDTFIFADLQYWGKRTIYTGSKFKLYSLASDYGRGFDKEGFTI